MKYLTLGAVITVLSFNLLAGHHEEPEGISGLVSSDVFDLAGEMDLYVEKYQNCGDAENQKHYHPVGTLVYILSGKVPPMLQVNGKHIQMGLIGLSHQCGNTVVSILTNQNLVMISALRLWL